VRYLLVALLVSACGTNLVETRPRAFEINYSMGGGMMDSSEGMTIKPDICKYTRRYEGIVNSFTFKLKKQELDKLYQVLRKNRFDKIQTAKDIIVHDKGGPSVYLKVGHLFYHVSTSGTYVTTGLKEWKNILNALMEIMKREREKQEKTLRIILDKSLVGKHIYIGILQKTVFYGLVKAQSKTRFNLGFIPGNYRIKTQLKKVFDEKNPRKYLYGPKGNIIYQQFNIHLPDDKRITIKLKNNKLSLK